MEKSFSASEWDKVFAMRWRDFGFPARRSSSVVLSGFNIRKLGKVANKPPRAWEFLAAYLKRCDLIAVQEVQDSLEAMAHLHKLIGETTYDFVVSDTTGRDFREGSGMSERLGFFYRKRRIERTAVASDISYDRGLVVQNVLPYHEEFAAAFKDKREADLRTAEQQKALEDAWNAGGKQGPRPLRAKDPFVLPKFLIFIRAPHAVSFRVPGRDGVQPFEFLAVNAHLLYGDKDKQRFERELEFMALMSWLVWRGKKTDVTYAKDLILLGDLNFDLEETDERREWVRQLIRSLNKGVLKSKKAARAYFPFIDVHPDYAEVFRTNAQKDQTYDQIAILSHDRRLPAPSAKDDPQGFDYGMFDFVELFSQALHGKALSELTKTQRKELYGKFEHDVSDHMPIWVRIPVPTPGMGTFTE